MKSIYSLIKAVTTFVLFGIIYGGVAGAVYGSVLLNLEGGDLWGGLSIGFIFGFVLGAIGGIVFGLIGGMSGNAAGWSLGGFLGGMVSTALSRSLVGQGPRAAAIPRPIDTFNSLAELMPAIILASVGLAVGLLVHRKPKLPLFGWLARVEKNSVVFQWPVWLRTLLSGVGIVVVVIWAMRCPAHWYVDAGRYETEDAGERASIHELSARIKQCPHAESYTVGWSYKGTTFAGYGYQTTTYDRKDKMVGIERDPGSGFSESWGHIDERAVHAVAENSGPFEDFKKFSKKK